MYYWSSLLCWDGWRYKAILSAVEEGVTNECCKISLGSFVKILLWCGLRLPCANMEWSAMCYGFDCISQRYKVPYWAVLDLKEVGHSEEVSSREQAVEGHIYSPLLSLTFSPSLLLLCFLLLLFFSSFPLFSLATLSWTDCLYYKLTPWSARPLQVQSYRLSNHGLRTLKLESK